MGWILLFFGAIVVWLILANKKKKRKEREILDKLIKDIKETPELDIAVFEDSIKFQEDGVRSTKMENRWQSDNDDDLATIVIPPKNFRQTPITRSRNKVAGRWIKAGEMIEVHGRKIINGFFYYGEVLKSINGFSVDPSLVDPSLEVSYSMNRAGEDIGYWPSYERLNPGERATYLDWLASDRDNIFFGLSYAFIYLDGLERRVIIDSQEGFVTDSEFKEIFYEVKRLDQLYGDNHSFNRYSTNLMAIMCLLRPKVISIKELEHFKFHPLIFKIKLSQIVIEGKAISADLAYEWLVNFSEYRLLTPAKRCNAEFRKLFEIGFTKKFPEGFILKPNKTAIKVESIFANMVLAGARINIGFMPDITALKSPVNNQLKPLADTCTEKLDAFSRYLGREGNSETDINALMLLPTELLQDDNVTFKNLNTILSSEIEVTNGIMPVTKLWSLLGLDPPERINKKEIELLQSLCDVLGYGYAPDERYHNVRVKPDQNIVLYQNSNREEFIPSVEFQKIALYLRLGSLVALTDGQLDDNELNYLHSLIVNNEHLKEFEKESLRAYLKWRLHSQSTLAGLKSRIEKLGDKEIESIRSMIINVVLADGESSPDEIKQVEKIYRVLGLESSLVIKDIHDLSVGGFNRTLTNETITQGVAIDQTVLAQHKAETKHVQNMLQEIFSEAENNDDLTETIKEEVEEIAPQSEVGENNTLGLDSLHFQLYQRLVSRDEWSKDEMIILGEELNIMINGAIEVLNDWAFELVDSPIVEGSDPYYIDLEIVEEIEEKRV